MWSDDSKYNVEGPDTELKIRKPKGKRLDPKYTIGMVNHGGGKGARVWVCFSGFNGVGPMHQINRIMDWFVYRDIPEGKDGYSFW